MCYKIVERIRQTTIHVKVFIILETWITAKYKKIVSIKLLTFLKMNELPEYCIYKT